MTTAIRERQSVPAIDLDRDDQVYLDFTASLRGFALQTLIPLTKTLYDERVAAETAAGRPAPESVEDVDALIGSSLLDRFRGHFQYHAQQMKHRRTHELGDQQLDRLLPELDAPVAGAIGSLTLNPDLQLPDYYTGVLFHTSPSSFFRHPAAGPIYDLGFANYRLNRNDAYQQESAFVSRIPEGEYRDVLELGCGSGGATVPLKRRFRDANVYAIDAAAPMLKQAHKTLESQGLAVYLSQRLAEDTGFPDGSFDLVFALILFHEVSADAARAILTEVRRILRPGGLMAIADVEPYSKLDPFRRFITNWQVENNGEPFWRIWGETDACGLLRDCGFPEAWQTGLENPNFPGRNQYLTFGRA